MRYIFLLLACSCFLSTSYATVKRYAYPSAVYLNSADTTGKYQGYIARQKNGDWYLHLSFPEANAFLFKHGDEPYRCGAGAFGLSAGIDYYHSDHAFINFNIAAITSVTELVMFAHGEPIVSNNPDITYSHSDLLSSLYTGITNNHHINKFTLGYGLSFGANYWYRRYYNIIGANATKKHTALGLLFPAYFKIIDEISIGLVYRPTFVRFGAVNTFAYEHSLSIDLAWKIRLKSKKRNYKQYNQPHPD